MCHPHTCHSQRIRPQVTSTLHLCMLRAGYTVHKSGQLAHCSDWSHHYSLNAAVILVISILLRTGQTSTVSCICCVYGALILAVPLVGHVIYHPLTLIDNEGKQTRSVVSFPVTVPQLTVDAKADAARSYKLLGPSASVLAFTKDKQTKPPLPVRWNPSTATQRWGCQVSRLKNTQATNSCPSQQQSRPLAEVRIDVPCLK